MLSRTVCGESDGGVPCLSDRGGNAEIRPEVDQQGAVDPIDQLTWLPLAKQQFVQSSALRPPAEVELAHALEPSRIIEVDLRETLGQLAAPEPVRYPERSHAGRRPLLEAHLGDQVDR